MTVYRGGVGQWSWAFHRITGVGVLVFLCLHILDTSLIVLGPEHYNKIIAIYRLSIFRILEVGLFASVLFHALNGIRIILIDFWENLTRFHRQLFYLQMVCFILVMIPVTYLMLRPLVVSPVPTLPSRDDERQQAVSLESPPVPHQADLAKWYVAS